MNKNIIWIFSVIFLSAFSLHFIPARAVEVRGGVEPQIAAASTTQYFPSPQEVQIFVISEAKKYGVNPVHALWIVDHESQDGQNMRGDDSQSRGFWMISSIWHPEVSDACADDLKCSTDWSLNWIRKGHIQQWSTWKFRFQWYPYDNPPI